MSLTTERTTERSPVTSVLEQSRAGAREPGWGHRNWFGLCMLALMVASDYKLRVRSAKDTLSGGIDAFILLEIAIYGVVAAYLLLTQPELPRLRRRMPAALFLASAYVALLVVSATYSPFRSLAGVRAVEMLVLLALVARACRTATLAHLHRFAHGFLLLVAGSVVFGVVHPEPPVFLNQAGRFSWLRVHPIPAGVYAGLAFLVALTYVLSRSRARSGPRWPTWVYLVLGLLVGGGLLATQTRNAVLGAVVGGLVIVCSLYRGRRLVTIGLGLLVTLSAAVVLALGPVTAYFARGESSAKLASLNSRTDLWRLALQAVEKQPVFGYGQGASRGIFLDATGLGGGHNAIINIAVDLGLVGLLVWGALLVVVLCSALTLPKEAPDAATRPGLSAALARPVLPAPRTASRLPGVSSSPFPPGLRVDRALVLGALAFLLVDGMFYEGVGAVSNVAGDWLFVLVAWVVVLRRSLPRPVRPLSPVPTPVRLVAREP